MEESMFGLKGKVAVVTGSGAGIGRGCAVMLARGGARNVIVDINEETAMDAAREIRSGGGQALAVCANVLDPVQVDAVIQKALSELGSLDILVNNVGNLAGMPPTPFLEISDQHWDAMVERNLRVTFLFSREAAKAMAKAGKPGAIVNIASTGGIRGMVNLAHYGAAKAGVMHLTQTMALELAAYNIRVNCVAPGFTDNRIPGRGLTQDYVQRVAQIIPLKKWATPEDIGGAVLFLASDLAGHITGQTIVVDGGMMASGGGPTPERRR